VYGLSSLHDGPGLPDHQNKECSDQGEADDHIADHTDVKNLSRNFIQTEIEPRCKNVRVVGN